MKGRIRMEVKDSQIGHGEERPTRPSPEENMTHTTAYTLGGQRDKALKAYEKAHAWRELFTLARDLDLSATAAMVGRVTDYLASRGRHAEAGQVLIDYAADVDGAVDVLCRGAEFAEAYRLVSCYSVHNFASSDIRYPGRAES